MHAHCTLVVVLRVLLQFDCLSLFTMLTKALSRKEWKELGRQHSKRLRDFREGFQQRSENAEACSGPGFAWPGHGLSLGVQTALQLGQVPSAEQIQEAASERLGTAGRVLCSPTGDRQDCLAARRKKQALLLEVTSGFGATVIVGLHVDLTSRC